MIDPDEHPMGFKLGTQPRGGVLVSSWLVEGMIVYFRDGWREPGRGAYFGRFHRRRVIDGIRVKVEQIADGHVRVSHYP